MTERQLHEDFERFAIEELARLGVPSGSVGIVHGEDEYVEGFGVTNVDHPLPVDPNTAFMIGSIGKTYTATALMSLVESGEADLDAYVRNYIPDLQLSSEEAAASVTLLHLLTHTAGWDGDFIGGHGPGDDALARFVADLPSLPQISPVGETWSYNNSAFCLAGRVIEVITEKTYEAAIKDMIFDPLEMDHSFFFAADAITHRVAVGHRLEDDRPVVVSFSESREQNPAGGITSSMRDQIAYMRFHLGLRESAVLKPETVRFMQEKQRDAGSIADGVGISWMLRRAGDTWLVAHGGDMPGANASMILVPERRFAVAIAATGDPVGFTFCEQAARKALEVYLGIEEPRRVTRPSDQKTLAEYVGSYETTVIGIDLQSDDGGFLLTYGVKPGLADDAPVVPPMKLRFYEDDKVVVVDGPLADITGDFIRDSAGLIRWFRFAGRLASPVAKDS